MATVEQCQQALEALAQRLRAHNGATDRPGGFERTFSARLTEPDAAFAATLRDGALTDIRPVDPSAAGQAKIRLRMTGDDLVALAAGQLDAAQAWASGRLGVEANPFDLLKLRSLF